MRRRPLTPAIAGATVIASLVLAAPAAGKARWVAAWTAAPVAAYPAGYTAAQPGPLREAPPGNRQPQLAAAFPDDQARNQTLRMIIRPKIGGRTWRLRLTNQFGTQPVRFGRVTVGLQATEATIVRGTSRPITFSERRSVTVPAGETVTSDPVRLRLRDPQRRDLAISLHIPGTSGPMTWHGASFTTSYITDPNAGNRTADRTERAFPHSTTSWFFLAGLDVRRARAATVVAFGDSITDGYWSTLNEHDRWADVLQRRLLRRWRRADGRRPLISVVNQGITGNMVSRVGRLPGGCTPCDGPPALDRWDRDVLDQPGVRAVIVLEGINDLGGGGATAAPVIQGLTELVERAHARGIRVVGATLTPARGTPFGEYGTERTEGERRAVNHFIRTGGVFDDVADFSAATEDPMRPGFLRPAFDTNTTEGGPGDHLHPNRAGFQAMARAVDVAELERIVRSREVPGSMD